MSRFLDAMMVAGGAVIVAAILAVDARPDGDAGQPAAGAVAPLAVRGGKDAHDRSLALRPYLGKPMPPIRLRAVPVGELHSGQPGRLRVEVTAVAGIERIQLDIESDQWITIISSDFMEIDGLVRGGHHSVEMEVIPASGGVRRLAGSVTFEIDGERQAMPVSLVVPVAGPVTAKAVRAKPERQPVRDATGEWIYPLPAE